MEELIKLCVEKGIRVEIENIETLRGIGITFSKENKYFRRIIIYDEIFDMKYINSYINNLIKEAENELNH